MNSTPAPVAPVAIVVPALPARIDLGTQLSTSVQALYQELVDAPPVTDAASLAVVQSIFNRAHTLLSGLAEAETAAKRPFSEVVKQIGGLAATIKKPLQALKDDAGAQLQAYARQQNEARLRADQAARAAAAKATAQGAFVIDMGMLPSAPPAPLPSNTAALPKVEIFDPALVPDAYWVIDEVKLRQAALANYRAQKATGAPTPNSGIPGVRVTEDVQVRAQRQFPT